jgi:hypothetical protein
MSNEKFTQGEWVAKHRNNHELQTTFMGVVIGDEFIDFGFASRTEHKANAHLISAAPDMYRAGRDLINFVIDKYNLNTESDLTCPKMASLAKALAKADGGRA